jgi:hypothetical protein
MKGMKAVKAKELPLVVVARGCPEELAVGDTAVFTGELELRRERDE